MARALIADNAAFMRASLKYVLETAGHEVVGLAKDGSEAIALYRQLQPDLVTLDILMESMDGLTALREIVKLDPRAKVIMVTAMGQEATVEEAKQAGACGFIRKPFKPETVVADVQRALGLAPG